MVKDSAQFSKSNIFWFFSLLVIMVAAINIFLWNLMEWYFVYLSVLPIVVLYWVFGDIWWFTVINKSNIVNVTHVLSIRISEIILTNFFSITY